jgi:hypothetical protein
MSVVVRSRSTAVPCADEDAVATVATIAAAAAATAIHRCDDRLITRRPPPPSWSRETDPRSQPHHQRLPAKTDQRKRQTRQTHATLAIASRRPKGLHSGACKDRRLGTAASIGHVSPDDAIKQQPYERVKSVESAQLRMAAVKG